jgi:hypothetical protein
MTNVYMHKLIRIIVIITVLAAAWWLGSPLFLDQQVDEALPFADMSEQEYQDVVDAAVDVGVEAPSMDEIKQMNQKDMDTLEGEVIEASKKKEDVQVEDEMPAEPVVVASGSFVDADAFHKGSGAATIYALSDGSALLRLEDFSVTNGPDLRVLLAVNGNASQSIELGKLKGNLGDQNYEIDNSIDVSAYNSIIIYCKPFHVTFATASFE